MTASKATAASAALGDADFRDPVVGGGPVGQKHLVGGAAAGARISDAVERQNAPDFARFDRARGEASEASSFRYRARRQDARERNALSPG
jgi:hypothetical protein